MFVQVDLSSDILSRRDLSWSEGHRSLCHLLNVSLFNLKFSYIGWQGVKKLALRKDKSQAKGLLFSCSLVSVGESGMKN